MLYSAGLDFSFSPLFLLKWHIEPGSLIPLEKNELLTHVHFIGGTGQRQERSSMQSVFLDSVPNSAS